MRCGVCGEQYPEGARFCDQDGSALISNEAPKVDPVQDGVAVPEGQIHLEDVTSFEPSAVLLAGETAASPDALTVDVSAAATTAKIAVIKEQESASQAPLIPENEQDTAEEMLVSEVSVVEAPSQEETTHKQNIDPEPVSVLPPEEKAAPPIEEPPKKKYPTVEERIGTMVGTYRLTKKIGEGGMGVVYEAIHPIIERKIAIKLIQPEQADNIEAVRRFFDEARALSRSRHPNIVEVYDLGQLEDGTIFLEMELLNGHTLRDRLNSQGPLLLGEIQRIFGPIANALKTAHDAGIIHRDLKPENIFIGHDGSIKLLDFGVSKLQENQPNQEGEHTQAGMLVGTPEYMSPEQATGEELDHRADIYSFGVVLYEAACGILPYDDTILVDILIQHIQAQFPTPSARSKMPIDASLEALIMKCLEKSPAARYHSMGEIALLLQPSNAKPSSSFMRDSFGISQGVLPPQLAPQPGEVTPGDLRRGAPLGQDLRLKGGLWRRIDAANIGDISAEESHEMLCDGELQRRRLEGTFPNGRMLVDDGVIHHGALTVVLKGLAPGRDALLLLRMDVSTSSQVETLLNQEPISVRQPEIDEENCWRHETILIPGEKLKDGTVLLTRRPTNNTPGNLYALWVYQLVGTGPVKPLVL
jgi:serine/threonine protein kinase